MGTLSRKWCGGSIEEHGGTNQMRRMKKGEIRGQMMKSFKDFGLHLEDYGGPLENLKLRIGMIMYMFWKDYSSSCLANGFERKGYHYKPYRH